MKEIKIGSGYSPEEILDRLVKKGFYLHGTRRNVGIIKPQYAWDWDFFGYFGNLRAVYATDDPAVALFFAITSNKHFKRFDVISTVRCATRKFFLDKRHRQDLSDGFVYVVSAKNFERLGPNLVSFQSVKPLLKIRVRVPDFKYRIGVLKRNSQKGSQISPKIDFNEAFKIAEKHMSGREHGHGRSHIIRSLIYAKTMAQKICPEYYTEIMIGVLFHDIARKTASFEPGHAKKSSTVARRLITKHWPQLNKDKILYAIENHDRGYKSKDPVVGIIWDADRLDLCRTGISVDKRLLSTKIASKLIPFSKFLNFNSRVANFFKATKA